MNIIEATMNKYNRKRNIRMDSTKSALFLLFLLLALTSQAQKEDRFSIGVIGQPFYSQKLLFGEASEPYDTNSIRTIDYLQGSNGYELGICTYFRISTKMKIETGLSYIKKQVKNSYTQGANYIEIINGDTNRSYFANYAEVKIGYVDYFLSLPILLSYSIFEKNKFDLGAKAGFSIEVPFKSIENYSQYTYDFPFSYDKTTTTKIPFSIENMNSTFIIGIYSAYSLNRFLKVSIEPTASMQLKAIPEEYNLKSRYLTIGVQFGFYVNINSNKLQVAT